MAKELIPFNYDEIYSKVQDKFSDHGYDTEIGSNAMQLASIMSYVVSMLNAGTAMNIDEMILTRGKQRKNVLQAAREFGYEIKHITSYSYILIIKPTAPLTIGTGTEFTNGDKSYYYIGDGININSDKVGQEFGLIVTEGEFIDADSDPEFLKHVVTDEHYFDLPYNDVENDGIIVTVQSENEDTTTNITTWTRSKNYLLNTNNNHNVFARLDNLDTNTPRIYFKLGNLDNPLKAGDIVSFDVLTSTGVDGKADDLEEFETTIPNLEIVSAKLDTQGAGKESTESIKINAPLYNNSTNSLVTKFDYQAFFRRDQRVKQSVVWDGNDQYHQIAGVIWLSLLPMHTERVFEKTNSTWELKNVPVDLSNASNIENSYFTNHTAELIKSSTTDLKVPTLTLQHRHPIYLDFYYNVKISVYDRAKSPEEWNKLVFDTIDEYFISDELKSGAESFEKDFFQSKLNRVVDTKLSSNSGFDITLETKIHLTKYDLINPLVGYNYTQDEQRKESIIFHLGAPFESYTKTVGGVVSPIPAAMPTLFGTFFSTLGLDNTTHDLVVDFGNGFYIGGTRRTSDGSFIPDQLHPNPELGVNDIRISGNNYFHVVDELIYVYPILEYITTYTSGTANAVVEEKQVGEYRIFLDGRDVIEVELFVKNDFSDEGLEKSYLDNGLTLNVGYNTPNIRFRKNTLPRLRKVDFL